MTSMVGMCIEPFGPACERLTAIGSALISEAS